VQKFLTWIFLLWISCDLLLLGQRLPVTGEPTAMFTGYQRSTWVFVALLFLVVFKSQKSPSLPSGESAGVSRGEPSRGARAGQRPKGSRTGDRVGPATGTPLATVRNSAH